MNKAMISDQMAKVARVAGSVCEMLVMDRTGHSITTWNINTPVEVDAARAQFDSLVKAGYRAFRVEGNDNQGARMETFDPNAGKIMMVPHLVGG